MDIVRKLGCHDEQRHRENDTQTFHANNMAQAFLSEIGRLLNVGSVFGLQRTGLHKLHGYKSARAVKRSAKRASSSRRGEGDE